MSSTSLAVLTTPLSNKANSSFHIYKTGFWQSQSHVFIYMVVVKSEIIEDQNQKLEDEKKALQSELEIQIRKLQVLSGNVIYYEMQ